MMCSCVQNQSQVASAVEQLLVYNGEDCCLPGQTPGWQAVQGRSGGPGASESPGPFCPLPIPAPTPRVRVSAQAQAMFFKCSNHPSKQLFASHWSGVSDMER